MKQSFENKTKITRKRMKQITEKSGVINDLQRCYKYKIIFVNFLGDFNEGHLARDLENFANYLGKELQQNYCIFVCFEIIFKFYNSMIQFLHFKGTMKLIFDFFYINSSVNRLAESGNRLAQFGDRRRTGFLLLEEAKSKKHGENLYTYVRS